MISKHRSELELVTTEHQREIDDLSEQALQEIAAYEQKLEQQHITESENQRLSQQCAEYENKLKALKQKQSVQDAGYEQESQKNSAQLQMQQLKLTDLQSKYELLIAQLQQQ